MTTVLDVLDLARGGDEHVQLHVSQFVDDFHRADTAGRWERIVDPPATSGRWEGLLAGVVSAECREVDLQPPAWVAVTGSPEPFFAFPARGAALRLRRMIESPPRFRPRNGFVPEDYLSRA